MNKFSKICMVFHYDDQFKLINEALLDEVKVLEDSTHISNCLVVKHAENTFPLQLVIEGEHQVVSSDVLNKFVQGIEGFMQKNPSLHKEIELPLDDWFLPHPQDSVEIIEDYQGDTVETGGLQASNEGFSFLSKCSLVFLELIASHDMWEPGDGTQTSIFLHLLFVKVFGFASQEQTEFYNWLIDVNLERIKDLDGVEDLELWKKTLIQSIGLNAERQYEFIEPIAEHIWESIEDGDELDFGWMNNFIVLAEKMNESLQKLIDEDLYIEPNSFEYNQDLKTNIENQKKWLVFEYYIKSFHGLLGVQFTDELSVFAIMSRLNLSE